MFSKFKFTGMKDNSQNVIVFLKSKERYKISRFSGNVCITFLIDTFTVAVIRSNHKKRKSSYLKYRTEKYLPILSDTNMNNIQFIYLSNK